MTLSVHGREALAHGKVSLIGSYRHPPRLIHTSFRKATTGTMIRSKPYSRFSMNRIVAKVMPCARWTSRDVPGDETTQIWTSPPVTITLCVELAPGAGEV
jgi:hypothetical protein